MIREFGPADMVFLLQAAGWTVLLSAIAFAGGAIGGAVIALARTSNVRLARLAAIAFIQIVQGVPVLMLLFLAFYGLGLLGYRLPPLVAAAIAMTVYAASYLGDIWRGAIESIPRQQWEGGAGLGLTRFQQMRHIIVPQAVKVSIPPTVGFLVQLIKNTSVASIIGFVELTRAGQLVSNATFQPLIVFTFVGGVYVLLCLPLSELSRRLERRATSGARPMAMGI